MEVRLYVGNLNKSTTQEALNALFTQAGPVTSVEIIKDRETGGSKGFAFINVPDQATADKAISMFNAYTLDEFALKVNVAKPRA